MCFTTISHAEMALRYKSFPGSKYNCRAIGDNLTGSVLAHRNVQVSRRSFTLLVPGNNAEFRAVAAQRTPAPRRICPDPSPVLVPSARVRQEWAAFPRSAYCGGKGRSSRLPRHDLSIGKDLS